MDSQLHDKRTEKTKTNLKTGGRSTIRSAQMVEVVPRRGPSRSHQQGMFSDYFMLVKPSSEECTQFNAGDTTRRATHHTLPPVLDISSDGQTDSDRTPPRKIGRTIAREDAFLTVKVPANEKSVNSDEEEQSSEAERTPRKVTKGRGKGREKVSLRVS